jgi:hypothetical protein
MKTNIDEEIAAALTVRRNVGSARSTVLLGKRQKPEIAFVRRNAEGMPESCNIAIRTAR